jgi:DNA-binding transcriptional ArsR family regulator/uncharacterized protein YndB with AHSA1/START domain
VRDIQKVLAALASPVRREILSLIWDRELSAGEIAAAFPVTKPTISQHLTVLREAGLAAATAVGTSRRYRALPDALRGLHGALVSPSKWVNADADPADPELVPDVQTKPVVVAAAVVGTSQAVTYTAFTDPAVYSRWLGVPVSIQDGRFACTMEWGTSVRGRYELTCPPELIVMRWDFEDHNVPVPGREMTGYLRIRPHPAGAHVEVHQIVEGPAQAEFMQGAWAMVLGRLRAGVVRASDPGESMPPRAARPKRRDLAPHQPRARHSSRWGRSFPSVVSLPCPGYTHVASGSWPNRRSLTSSSNELKSAGELVLPTPPGNSESPVNTCGASASAPPASYSTARLPGVCPRRWMSDTEQSPKVSTAPCSARWPTWTGSSSASAGCATTTAPVRVCTSGKACQWSACRCVVTMVPTGVSPIISISRPGSLAASISRPWPVPVQRSR